MKTKKSLAFLSGLKTIKSDIRRFIASQGEVIRKFNKGIFKIIFFSGHYYFYIDGYADKSMFYIPKERLRYFIELSEKQRKRNPQINN